MCDLKKILQSRTEPLSVSIDLDGMLVAADFAWTSKYEFGIVFKHPEGDIDVGQNGPTHREFLSDSIVNLEKLSYEEQKEVAIAAYCNTMGDLEPGEVPWASDTEEALADWLDELCDLSANYMLEYLPCSPESEFSPGLVLYDSLSKAVRKRLGMEKVDIGGPASDYIWAVHVNCSADDLNKALKKAKLPFLVI